MKKKTNSLTRCDQHQNHVTPYDKKGKPIGKRKRIYWHPLKKRWVWACRDCMRDEGIP